MNNAFEYILKAGGVQLEEDYSYRGYDCDKCKFNKSKIAVSVANFSVVSTDEGQIAANLIKNGPLAGINTINTNPSFLWFVLCYLIRYIYIRYWI